MSEVKLLIPPDKLLFLPMQAHYSQSFYFPLCKPWTILSKGLTQANKNDSIIIVLWDLK